MTNQMVSKVKNNIDNNVNFNNTNVTVNSNIDNDNDNKINNFKYFLLCLHHNQTKSSNLFLTL